MFHRGGDAWAAWWRTRKISPEGGGGQGHCRKREEHGILWQMANTSTHSGNINSPWLSLRWKWGFVKKWSKSFMKKWSKTLADKDPSLPCIHFRLYSVNKGNASKLWNVAGGVEQESRLKDLGKKLSRLNKAREMEHWWVGSHKVLSWEIKRSWWADGWGGLRGRKGRSYRWHLAFWPGHLRRWWCH